jgi:hypothetical protein
MSVKNGSRARSRASGNGCLKSVECLVGHWPSPSRRASTRLSKLTTKSRALQPLRRLCTAAARVMRRARQRMQKSQRAGDGAWAATAAYCFRSQRPVSASQAQSLNRRFRSGKSGSSLTRKPKRSQSSSPGHLPVHTCRRGSSPWKCAQPSTDRNAYSVQHRRRRDGVRRWARCNPGRAGQNGPAGNLQFCDSGHLHPRQSVRRWRRTRRRWP